MEIPDRMKRIPQLAALALAATIAYASLSWFLMERHLLHHKLMPSGT